MLVEGIMDAEVSSRIGAEYGERCPERVTQRNGYRSRAWDTRVGTMELHIPKLREGSYFPSLLEPRRRSERTLLAGGQRRKLEKGGQQWSRKGWTCRAQASRKAPGGSVLQGWAKQQTQASRPQAGYGVVQLPIAVSRCAAACRVAVAEDTCPGWRQTR